LRAVDAIDGFLRGLPWWEATLLLLAQNVVVFALSLAGGGLVARTFAHRRVAAPPPPLSRIEVAAAAGAILINTAVTVAGYALWRAGIVHFRNDFGPRAWLDVVVLLGVMDLAMYVLHRVAHVRLLFPLLHAFHHRFDRPRPLTLFALNPAETLSFGALWLVVITLYSASWLGMSVYLVLNVAFGTLGHVGVEPLPARWARLPLVRHLGTSTFHAQHHAHKEHNFGFYTVVWDRVFGTLDPAYDATLRGGP
jgi:sterol desaturase/sphingolipid hydroxylase (fatty acid hydroxylase superfamily)